jgi:hypothetical protein
MNVISAVAHLWLNALVDRVSCPVGRARVVRGENADASRSFRTK